MAINALIRAYNAIPFVDNIDTIGHITLGSIGGSNAVTATTGNLQQIESRAALNAIPSMPAIALPATIPSAGGGGGGGKTPSAGISKDMLKIANMESISTPISALNPGKQFGIQERMANITVNVQGADPQQVVNALERYVRQNGALPSALL